MNKYMINVLKVRTGDILAEDVLNSNGVKIVSKHTTINDYIKNQLFSIGIDKVWIFDNCDAGSTDENSTTKQMIKDSYEKTIAIVKMILNRLSSGTKIKYDQIYEIVDVILAGKDEADSVIKCINELRSFDEYTYTHSINTAFYAMLIGKWLKLPEKCIRDLIIAGALHDLGKIDVPSSIINKKGKLDDGDFDHIKKHPLYGYSIINDIENIDINVKRAVLMHHERMDGSGYPLGVKGDEIHIYARIIAIADVYDAITSDRVYKKKSTPFEALEFFSTLGLAVLDINILKVFTSNLATCYIGTKVKLSNGQAGKVVYIPPQDLANPIVKTDSDYIDFSQEKNIKIMSIAN